MTGIPAELEDFERVLVRRLGHRQATLRRRRLATLAVAGALALTATAVAGTLALDQPTVAQQDHTQNLAAARALISGFTAGDAGPEPDLAATRLLATLGAATGTYAGLNAYVAPTRDGGSCIALLNAASCGGPPTAEIPVRALGLGEYSDTPFLLIGIEGDFVARHVIRCGSSSEDVTGNAGGTTFVYVAPRPSIDPSACTQVFTLRDGRVVTTPI